MGIISELIAINTKNLANQAKMPVNPYVTQGERKMTESLKNTYTLKNT